jgi:hypothetical protein
MKEGTRDDRNLAAPSAEARVKGEALIRQAERLLCESWNERMWSDRERTLAVGRKMDFFSVRTLLRTIPVRSAGRYRSGTSALLLLCHHPRWHPS